MPGQNEEPRLGITLLGVGTKRVVLARTTLESRIDLTLEDAARRAYQIQTGNKFFNHMLTGLASRACLNLDVTYRQTQAEALDHVVTEDTGLALGRAVREMLDARIPAGVNGRGSYTVAFDEGLVTATVAFDGRAYTLVHGTPTALRCEHVEDILVTSLRQFFDGFAQGAGVAVHLQLHFGEDPHHLWEAVFKAFGEALREALSPCPYRAGTTIGLKGTGREK